MEAGILLFRLLALLLAARFAAELAERLRMPAVLVEISAGVLLGPSLLGWVGDQESLHFLGELGAIFLLMEVGLHMDLGDLRRVGRSAMQVAIIGVAVPMAFALMALRAMGIDPQVALFLAAGITATSVGITARVFADMRSLATTEAQTVLGAAVADDVIGLLILTVVVRLGATGTVDIASIAVIAVTGIGFVAVSTAVGAWLTPHVFDRLVGRARTEGALIGGAVALTLAFAGLASAARLAPIVGAFVAGVALGRIKQQEELRERMAPVTHLFVPVFFLLIGAEARLSAFVNPDALVLIAVLGTIAVIGKLLAGLGASRGKADRMVIGIGMVPRGEVGVVFATLGLSSGVLGARDHAALLFVVLATTIVAPPWLRRRIERGRRVAMAEASDAEPQDGWLAVGDDEVELRAEPPLRLAPTIGLDAARLCRALRPGQRLLDWLSKALDEPPLWDDDLRRRFLALLRDGNARSWRFMDVTGLLATLLPDIEAAMRQRKQDVFDLDPSGAMRWREVDAINESTHTGDLASIWSHIDQDAVLVAALARSAFRGPDAPANARRMGLDLGLDADFIEFLVAERELLPAASARISMGREEFVLEIADHIGNSQRLDALYLLAITNISDPTHREGLRELYGLLVEVLTRSELSHADAVDLAESRKRDVLAQVRDPDAAKLLDAVPRRYLLSQQPSTIARHIRMLETPLARGEFRIHADPVPGRREWIVHLVTQDRPGILAAIGRAFAAFEIPIEEAWVSTWSNGLVVDVFRAQAGLQVDWDAIRHAAEANVGAGNERNGTTAIEGSFRIDNEASPWHTIVEVRAEDRAGLLYRVAEAFARAQISIHHATLQTEGDVAVDSFMVTDRSGAKLSLQRERALTLAFEGKTVARWPRRRVRTH